MKTNTANVLTSAMLRKAIRLTERIENKRESLAADEAELASILNTPVSATSAPVPVAGVRKTATKGKRTMSPETKAKIAAGQAKRWAAQKAAGNANTQPVATKASTPAPSAPVASVA